MNSALIGTVFLTAASVGVLAANGLDWAPGRAQVAGDPAANLQISVWGAPLEIEWYDTLIFNAALENFGDVVGYFDAAKMVITGPANLTIPLYDRRPVPVNPGDFLQREISQYVPDRAPEGDYHVEVQIELEGDLLDAAGFDITVLPYLGS